MKKYNVNLYYTTYQTWEIEAETPEDAIDKACNQYMYVNGKYMTTDLVDNLCEWQEAHEAIEIV